MIPRGWAGETSISRCSGPFYKWVARPIPGCAIWPYPPPTGSVRSGRSVLVGRRATGGAVSGGRPRRWLLAPRALVLGALLGAALALVPSASPAATSLTLEWQAHQPL